MRRFRAGATYFALVFAAGFMFGVVRQFALVPRFGATVALIVEAPFILAVSALAARRCIGSCAARGASDAVSTGAIALALLLLSEALMAGPVRGWSFDQWLSHFSTVDGAISLGLYLAFAAMPWVVWRLAAGRH